MLNIPKSLEGFGLMDGVKTDLLIGGAWRQGAENKRIDVLDPSTGQVIADIADATVDDGLAAVDAASDAAASWAATPPRQRGEILRKCFELMVARAEMLARLISLENGKALPDARGEVAYAAEFFRWFSEEAVRINGDLSLAPNGNNRIMVQYQPIGVSVLITPWNFPAAMATRKMAPALAAGCTVVLKPATETPLTAYAMAALMDEAGVPKGVVNVVTSSKTAKLISAMLHHPKVRKLSFTGSTHVGRILLREAADQVISCSMELGGNAPFVVFDDADLEKALDGAMIAKMRNGGEACTAANRFYVQAGIADKFARGLAERMGAMRLGAGYEEGVTCGPMINLAAIERIDEWVREAVEDGAHVLVGGEMGKGDGYFYPPTVVTKVPGDANLVRDEIFGPVAPITVFETMDEAIALANDSEYGLIAYVYTEDMKKGLQVADRFEAGMVGLNRGLVSDPAAPFGGVKQSGLGREGAHHGILEFCEAKYTAVSW
ncbi:NAD-dependent succinate-semialdehyde dehydrogenase [Devosia rhodophyticola]|uniref:NAD-dependent succinate-semialdehyde dehydrogenase n=1 Tax=Devosia rhodophyticola TaxID=3026423 RepID=A0ABY7YUF8_9HYPH|nr:NAD-dependent succinate-semialdehyde dehydrogenase [Devosia rhodophyticola]WDR04812.1 NAD-dependent succinate-semialdehyde dehydrogenase [Devosia rhodophyticola]